MGCWLLGEFEYVVMTSQDLEKILLLIHKMNSGMIVINNCLGILGVHKKPFAKFTCPVNYSRARLVIEKKGTVAYF